MRTPLPQLWIAGVILAVSLTLPTQAHAQDPAAQPEYRHLIDLALSEYRLGHWGEARAAFEKAHAIYPNARSSRGVGMAAFQERDYVQAVEMLSHALKSAEQPLPPALRESTQEILNQAAIFVGRLQLTLEPAHARLELDDRQVVTRAGEDILLNPGEHQLVASAPDHVGVRRSLNVRGGERVELVLRLEPHAGAATPGAPSDAAPQPIGRGADATRSPRMWTWIAAGAAGVFAVTAGLTWLAANGERDDVVAACKAMPCSREDRDRLLDDTSVGTFETLTTVSLALSGATLVSAGVLFFAEGSADAEPSETAFDIGPGSARLRVVF